MKSLDELKEIAATYSSGPIMSVALKDAIKWIEAYRKVAIHALFDAAGSPGKFIDEMAASSEVDAEAKEIVGK